MVAPFVGHRGVGLVRLAQRDLADHRQRHPLGAAAVDQPRRILGDPAAQAGIADRPPDRLADRPFLRIVDRDRGIGLAQPGRSTTA